MLCAAIILASTLLAFAGAISDEALAFLSLTPLVFWVTIVFPVWLIAILFVHRLWQERVDPGYDGS